MDVYVIRHPEPAIESGVCYGQLDVPPKPGFEPAFSRAAELIPRTSRIYTSPLQRCRLAAEVLAAQAGLGFTQDSGLMEMHFGSWEGVAWSNLHGSNVRSWMENFTTQRAPNGESFLDLQDRLSSFLDETLSQAVAGTLTPVLVTHAGVIRAMHLRWSGLNVDQVFRMKIPFAELIRFAV